jgi:hypothetical protein
MEAERKREIARKLLEFYSNDSERWTRGAFARDATGYQCMSSEKVAACWCLTGAMYKLGIDVLTGCNALGFEQWGEAEQWNDRSTFADVAALLTRVAGGESDGK